VTAQNVQNYIDLYFDKKLERHVVKSPPYEWPGHGVRRAVYDDFGKIVMDPSKHVIVLFSSTTLPTSFDFEFVFDELAALYHAHLDTILFVKYDVDENEVPKQYDIKVSMPPVVRLFLKGDKKEMVHVSSKTDAAALVDVVNKHTGLEVKYTQDNSESMQLDPGNNDDDDELDLLIHDEL